MAIKVATEDVKLKQFMLENFDFSAMKGAGFYKKEIRKNDFKAQADRVCQFFGYKTVYEYNPPEIVEHESGTIATGKFSDTINDKGELVEGGGIILGLIQTAFYCPICTCPQRAEDHPKFNTAKLPIVTVKCKGCKRKLSLLTDIFSGALTVTDLTPKTVSL